MAAVCWDLKPQQRVTSLQKGDSNPPANLRTVQTGKIGGGDRGEGDFLWPRDDRSLNAT